jgi:hypothetical protein
MFRADPGPDGVPVPTFGAADGVHRLRNRRPPDRIDSSVRVQGGFGCQAVPGLIIGV